MKMRRYRGKEGEGGKGRGNGGILERR